MCVCAYVRGCNQTRCHWQFAAEEPHDGYLVTVEKESGEAPSEPVTTTQPEVQLILSYSAYRVNVSAFNNASVSPAASRAVPRHAHTGERRRRRRRTNASLNPAHVIRRRRSDAERDRPQPHVLLHLLDGGALQNLRLLLCGVDDEAAQSGVLVLLPGRRQLSHLGPSPRWAASPLSLRNDI